MNMLRFFQGWRPDTDALIKPLFQITPDKFMLGPFESQTVIIEGISNRYYTVNRYVNSSAAAVL